MAMTPAMESIFANAQQNAASLIETATLAINAKVNTVEEAEAMIQELSSEAVKYNELLTCIMNAMRQVESGDMQKEEAAGIIAPAVKELKDKCTALKIANVEAPGDDITEDEIATLRELIIGTKAAAEDRLVAIRLCDDCKVDPEVENELNPPEENGEAFEFDPATEGISSFIQKMHEKKVNKAKVTVLMDSLKDKKTDAIVKKVIDAMKPALVAGADGLSAIKRDVDEMQKADGDPSKYEGKLSSFDCVVKTISGVGVGYIPDNPSEGTGLAWIAVPTKDHKGNVISTVITVRTACEYILNPIKESEVTEAMEAYEEIAEEAAFLAAQYVNTTECKTAKALYQNAKKLYSMGSKEKALEYMKKAKDLYDKCLKKLLNESGKFERAERIDPIKKHGGTATIRHNITRTDSLTFAIARSKLETKIDRCTAHILQWTTKAGKETYQQTLDQLKADREQAKAAKKAAKAKNKNTEMEENTMENFNYSEFMFACESMMDELELDLATDCAMEADGSDSSESNAPSTLANRVRSAFAKLRSAFKRGDKQEVEEAKKEADAATKELADAAEAAPADKKEKYKKAAKIAGIAVASTAAAVGLTMGGTAIYQKVKGQDIDPTALFKIAGKVTAEAGRNVGKKVAGGAKAVATAPGNAINAKKDKATVEERKESLKKMGFEPKDDASMLLDPQNDRRAAKRKAMAKKAKAVSSTISSHMPKLGKGKGKVEGTGDSMGYEAMEAYDIYELIMEAYDAAMMDAENEFSSSDEDLTASIEAML